MANDNKQRYSLQFEPRLGADAKDAAQSLVEELTQDSAEGTWWVRANQGHSLEVRVVGTL